MTQRPTEPTEPTPAVQTLFNTGNLYTAQGQRIVAVQFTDGTVSFEDLDRCVSGTITDGSSYGGEDAGGPSTFGLLEESTLAHIVTRRYANGSRYAMGTVEREHTMRGIARTVRDRIRIADKANKELQGARDHHAALDASTTREDLIGWLCACDRNGVWTDEDMVAEGCDPMTLDEAWAQVERMAYESCDDCGEPATHERYDGHGPTEYACMDCRSDGAPWARC